MVTVTIAKSYFEALLQRAEPHISQGHVDSTPSLSQHVTISRAEHQHLLQSEREYRSLRGALLRGGAETETLDLLLLEGESDDGAAGACLHYDSLASIPSTQSKPETLGLKRQYGFKSPAVSDNTWHGSGPRGDVQRSISYVRPESCIDITTENDDEEHEQGLPVQDQRTIFITNLPKQTTHKDLAGIIRGGRLLDIFLRNDHAAVISFVEGAAEFMRYVKRTDIYLHTKRLEFRWATRQFHMPSHMAKKIAHGATRNLVIRGASDNFTAAQIRDHLDHIHNLVVIDINFRNGDAFIYTNSIHNALFAKTCMISRTEYKGFHVEHFEDECAAQLPQARSHVPTPPATFKDQSMTNAYALLSLDSDQQTDSEDDSLTSQGVRLDAF